MSSPSPLVTGKGTVTLGALATAVPILTMGAYLGRSGPSLLAEVGVQFVDGHCG